MRFGSRLLLEKHEDFFENCNICRRETYQLMEHLEILFYAYGLLSVSVPQDVSGEDAALMKHVLMDGHEMGDNMLKLLNAFEDDTEDVEEKVREIGCLVNELHRVEELPLMLCRVMETVGDHVKTYCPHAGASDGFWNALHTLEKGTDRYREVLEDLLKRGETMMIKLYDVLIEYRKFLEIQ